MFLFLYHGQQAFLLEHERSEFDFRAFNRELGGLGLGGLSMGGALFYARGQRRLLLRAERIFRRIAISFHLTLSEIVQRIQWIEEMIKYVDDQPQRYP